MARDTLWTGSNGMLLAAASPASAGSYTLGQLVLKAYLAQRNTGIRNTGSARSGTWLSRFLDRLDQYAWKHEMRQREAFLARAQNLADLECRMHDLERGRFSGDTRNPL